jgi:hypothetical protein
MFNGEDVIGEGVVRTAAFMTQLYAPSRKPERQLKR